MKKPAFGITIEAVFPATHQLPLPAGGFEPLHGHDWKVVVELRGPKLDRYGVLVDFLDLQKSLAAALKPLRYKCLNDVAAFKKTPPSAEAVARVVYLSLQSLLGKDKKYLSRVTVTEAPGCKGWFGC